MQCHQTSYLREKSSQGPNNKFLERRCSHEFCLSYLSSWLHVHLLLVSAVDHDKPWLSYFYIREHQFLLSGENITWIIKSRQSNRIVSPNCDGLRNKWKPRPIEWLKNCTHGFNLWLNGSRWISDDVSAQLASKAKHDKNSDETHHIGLLLQCTQSDFFDCALIRSDGFYKC